MENLSQAPTLPISSRAYAKIILFGEHAVVHGQPAIAVPLQALSAHVTAEASPKGSGLSISLPHSPELIYLHSDNPSVGQTLRHTAKLTLERLAIPEPDLKLSLHSNIPMGAGFGSGAAVSTALVRALCAAIQAPLTNETLNALIYDIEKLYHGTPSGIDNTVIVYEQPVFFIREKPIESFKIHTPFNLLIARVDYATPTYITVGDVRTLYESQPQQTRQIFDQIGAIVHQARHAIETGSIPSLGPLMNQNHALLRQLTVSDENLDRLCDAALQAGAWGAKLSGGGRGGNMLILLPEEPALRPKIENALLQAGASEVFFTSIN